MYSSSAAAPTSHAFSAITVRLNSARDQVERRFLQAGDVLGQAAEALGQLVGSLDRLVQALDSPAVTSATARLRDSAAALLTLPEHHAQRLSVIAGLAQEGRDLAANVEDMKRNLAYLRAFASSIKITGAGIRRSSHEFGEFAEEICQRIEQGRTRLGAFETELAALFELFENAFAHETKLTAQCGMVLPAVPNSLCASADEMTRHHARVAEVAGQVAGLGRSVQSKVGSALAGLQVGDITRQRIEHVVEILSLADATGGTDQDQRRRLNAFVNALLAEQLRAASADFHHEIESLRRAMDGLAGDAGAMLSLRDLALGRDKGQEGILRRLDSDMAKALGLVGGMADAACLANDLSAAAAAGVASLGEGIVELQDIKTEVQHMAVNTTLKCSRFGEEGKPLAVIAVELRQQASLIEVSARAALNRLDAVSSGAGRLSQDQEAAKGGATASDIGVMLEQVRTALRQISETVEADLGAVAAQGAAVADGLRDAAASLDLKTEIGAVIDDVARALGDEADPDPAQVHDLAGPLGTLLMQAASRYTMVSERRVHAEITAGLDFDVPTGSPVAAKAAA